MLVSASTVVVLAVTEGGWARTILSLSVVVQTLTALWLLRRFVPGIWGSGGRVPFTQVGQFGRILAIVVGAALFTAVLRSVASSLFFEPETLTMFVGRAGRQASAMATIGIFGLLVGGGSPSSATSGDP